MWKGRGELTAGLTGPSFRPGSSHVGQALVCARSLRALVGANPHACHSSQGWPAGEAMQKMCPHAWQLLPKTTPTDSQRLTCSHLPNPICPGSASPPLHCGAPGLRVESRRLRLRLP